MSWLNRYWKWGTENECHIRKARLYGYLLWPFLFAIDVPITFITRLLPWIFFTFLFLIKLPIKSVLTPWNRNNILDLKDNVNDWNSYINFEQEKDHGASATTLYKITFIPIIPLFILLIVAVVTTTHDTLHQLNIWTVIIILCSIFLFLAFIDLISEASYLSSQNESSFLYKINKRIDEWYDSRLQKRRKNLEWEQKQLLLLMSCESTTSLDINSLPKSAPIIKLRYHDFKSKVCKPLTK